MPVGMHVIPPANLYAIFPILAHVYGIDFHAFSALSRIRVDTHPSLRADGRSHTHKVQVSDSEPVHVVREESLLGARRNQCAAIPMRPNHHWACQRAGILWREVQAASKRLLRLKEHLISRIEILLIDPSNRAPRLGLRSPWPRVISLRTYIIRRRLDREGYPEDQRTHYEAEQSSPLLHISKYHHCSFLQPG